MKLKPLHLISCTKLGSLLHWIIMSQYLNLPNTCSSTWYWELLCYQFYNFIHEISHAYTCAYLHVISVNFHHQSESSNPWESFTKQHTNRQGINKKTAQPVTIIQSHEIITSLHAHTSILKRTQKNWLHVFFAQNVLTLLVVEFWDPLDLTYD